MYTLTLCICRLSRYSGRARVGKTETKGTEWVSATTLVCTVAGGAEGSLMVVMSVGVWSGSTTETSSYDAGTVSSWRAWNEATTGGTSLSVMGASFGRVR